LSQIAIEFFPEDMVGGKLGKFMAVKPIDPAIASRNPIEFTVNNNGRNQRRSGVS
jgi:hypothetical protein